MRYKFITNIKKSLQSQIWKGSFQLPLKGRLETSLPCHVYAFTIVLLTLLVGCAHDENNIGTPDNPGFEEGIPTEVTITLSTRAANAQTRADKDPDGDVKDPTESVELIHNWWIAFVSKKIITAENDKKSPDVKIFTSANVTDKVTSTSSSVSDPKGGFEAETFKIIIPSGEYRIYAFANIDPKSEDDFKKFLKFDNGSWKHKTMHLQDLIGDNQFVNGGMQWPDTQNIPMTGVMTEKVIKNTVEEAFNIEVVRAVAKVEFAFSNPSTDNITLKNLEFSPITKDENISFVPNYDAIGVGPNNKLFDDVKQTGTLSFNNINKILQPKTGSDEWQFYCKESIPQKNGGPFTIKLTVNKKAAGSETGDDIERTLYTKDITYINRNDWIYIPIKFYDWTIYWKLHYYPPIGGYPPVFDQEDNGSSMSATLTTGGEFELYPVKIVQNVPNSTQVDYWNLVDWDNTGMKVEVLSGADLFVKAPEIVDNNNNGTGHPLVDKTNFPKIIVGELKEKLEGNQPQTAKIKITFYLKDSKYTGTIFPCLFTIHRQNSSPN